MGWDVNLASGNFFAQNDYAFITNANLFRVLNNSRDISQVNPEDPAPPGDMALDFEDGIGDKYFTLSADVMGPSFFIDLNTIGIGFFTRARMTASAQKIPETLGYYNFQNTPLGQSFSTPSIQSAGMVWTEFGLNVAKTISADSPISVGMSLKYLIGYQGYYGHTTGILNLTRLDGNVLQIENSVGELAFTNGLSTTSNRPHR